MREGGAQSRRQRCHSERSRTSSRSRRPRNLPSAGLAQTIVEAFDGHAHLRRLVGSETMPSSLTRRRFPPRPSRGSLEMGDQLLALPHDERFEVGALPHEHPEDLPGLPVVSVSELKENELPCATRWPGDCARPNRPHAGAGGIPALPLVLPELLSECLRGVIGVMRPRRGT